MQFPPEVLAVLTDSRTIIRDGKVAVPFEIDRTSWERVNKVLKEMGGRWDGRKAIRGHVFPHRIEEHMRQCLAAGEYPTKNEQGWFPTPPRLVMSVLDRAGIYAGMTLLEPSAGSGAIVTQAAQRGAVVDAVELDEHRVRILRDQGEARTVTHGDFLDLNPLDCPEPYNRIVMNPPFAEGLDHMRHAIGFLAEDALLVSIMSSGILWWTDRKAAAFRELVDRVDGDIEKLPEDSFRECGTSISACLVYLPAGEGCSLPTWQWHQERPKQLDLFG